MRVETRWAVAIAFILGAWVGIAQAPGIPQVDFLKGVTEAIASVVQRPSFEGCVTDSECILQCLRELPPNRPDSECDEPFGIEEYDPEDVEYGSHWEVYKLVRQ